MQLLLVHGAWTDSRSWDDLRAAWTSGEHQLAAIDLPSVNSECDLSADAAAVADQANKLAGEVILVGHSYGGAVVTEAAADVTNLVGVIYLSAFRPDVGQSVTEASRLTEEPSRLDRAISLIDGALVVDLNAAGGALYGTTDPEVVARCLAEMHPQPVATFRQKLTRDVPEGVHTHYIECGLDDAVPLALQRIMSDKCDSVSLGDSSHCPQNEFPEATAEHMLAVVQTLYETS